MSEKEFVQYMATKLKADLKTFPGDFYSGTLEKEVELPGKSLMPGSELFGTIEIIDSEGHPVYKADDMSEAKFLLYSNREYPRGVMLPEDISVCEPAVKEYEKYLDSLVKNIMLEYEIKVKDGKDAMRASNNVFNQLNLRRY